MIIQEYLLRLRPNSSLYISTRKYIRERNPYLYTVRNLDRKSRLLAKVSSPTSYVIVPLFVIVLFSLCFIDFGFYNINNKLYLGFIKIDGDFVKTFIDQRISNIATITSISLVVVGFLINNIKEKSKETYELLFRETYLYPIIYLILSSIAILLISTFLRESICIGRFSNMIVLSLVLILAILVCIGKLFSKLLQFVTAQGLNSLTRKTLTKQAKIILYEEKIQRLSQDKMLELIQPFARPVSSFYFSRQPNHLSLEGNGTMYISDIDTIRLRLALQNINCPNISSNMEFLHIGLLYRFEESAPYTVASVSNNVAQQVSIRNALNSYIHLRKADTARPNFSEINARLYDKLKTSIDSKDVDEVRNALNSYDEVLNIYFNNF